MAVNKTIIRIDGLSTDRVNVEVDEDLILCPICSNILWKPITCKTCENSFCLNCIRLWLNEKPNKCPFNCVFQERKAPGILLKLLSKLKIDCINKSNGCTLSLPYEALEKHQLEECLFRFVQCSFCLQEMLFKDFDIHQKDICYNIQSTCLKCTAVYNTKEGHTHLDCLKKQSQIIQEALEASERDPTTIMKNFEKISRLYRIQEANQIYAERNTFNNSTPFYVVPPSASREQSLPLPSAPFEEPPSSIPSQSESSANLQTSTTNPTVEPKSVRSKESLRISTVNFARIVVSKKEGGYIPNGYAAFYWENAHYMFKEYASQHYHLKGFLNAFTNYSTCVAYNGKGESMSIFLPNSENKFDLHSFAAISIYHDNFKLSLTGYRSNNPLFVKHIILNNKDPKLFEINWEKIDKITFKPSDISYTSKPETFALINLNFIL